MKHKVYSRPARFGEIEENENIDYQNLSETERKRLRVKRAK